MTRIVAATRTWRSGSARATSRNYDYIIATLDGPIGEPRVSEHPERDDLVGFVAVGEEHEASGRFHFEQRRFERLTEGAGALKALFDDFYVAVALP